MIIISGIILLRVLYLLFAFTTYSRDEWLSVTERPDSHGYLALADDLRDFRLDEPSYRTPGYPFMILLLEKLPGTDLRLKILLFQQVLDGITAYLLFSIASLAFRKYAVIPSVLYLLHPFSLSYSSSALPAIPAAFFVTLFTYLLLRFGQLNKLQAALLGIVISVGTMVRPMLMYSPLVFGGYMLISNRKRLRQTIVPVLFFLFFAYSLPFLQTQYNKNKFGLNSISSQGSFELAARLAVITGFRSQEKIFGEGGFGDSLANIATHDGKIDYEELDSICTHISIELLKRDPVPV